MEFVLARELGKSWRWVQNLDMEEYKYWIEVLSIQPPQNDWIPWGILLSMLQNVFKDEKDRKNYRPWDFFSHLAPPVKQIGRKAGDVMAAQFKGWAEAYNQRNKRK